MKHQARGISGIPLVLGAILLIIVLPASAQQCPPLDALDELPGVAALFGEPDASSPPRIDIGHEYLPGEVVARFRLDLTDEEIKDIARTSGAHRVERLSPLGLFLLHGPHSVPGLERLMERLWETRTAVSIGANYLGGLAFQPNDPHHVNGNQWYHEAPSDIDLDLRGAWDITRGSSDVVVAVVDSGIWVDHPEFAGRLYVNPGEIPGNGIDDDGNCYIDDVSGWNAVPPASGNVNDTTVGHGTYVASILMANSDNNHQVAGFDHHVRLLPIKALEATNGPEGQFRAALDYLVLNPGIARIVNLSLADYREFTSIRNALTAVAQSSILIGGSGNNGPGQADDGYPESHPAVITISGTDQFDELAYFPSNNSTAATGASVDFSAPAVDIFTASWAEPDDPFASHVGPGTSFATPMVSGIATLALSIWPTMTKTDLVLALQASAVDLGEPGWDPEFGWGRVNAREALLALPVIFMDDFETGEVTKWSSASP